MVNETDTPPAGTRQPGRPLAPGETERKRQLTIRLPPSLLRSLAAHCKAIGLTPSAYIRKMIEDALKAR